MDQPHLPIPNEGASSDLSTAATKVVAATAAAAPALPAAAAAAAHASHHHHSLLLPLRITSARSSLLPAAPRPQDFGYDISNYEAVDPAFGSLSILRTLIRELHRRGIRTIMDLVPNHTSDSA